MLSPTAFPEEITRAVYTTPQYANRGQNGTVSGFDDDGEFSDGVEHQMCSVTRNAASGGYDAALEVGVAI